jgi:murein L,D-transpeptidase YcbB/YkuD
MNRSGRLTGALMIGVCCSLSLAPEAFAAQTPAHRDSVTAILRQVAQRGQLEGLRWSRFPSYRAPLDSLYSRSGWSPIWSADGHPKSSAHQAIQVLQAAEERGLHPADYDAEPLARRFQALSSTKSPSAHDVAWFDLALSVDLLRHLSDVHRGRVNPKSLSVGINVEPKKDDLAAKLRQALERRSSMVDLVRQVEPPFEHYKRLKAAYALYRTLAAAPPLPTVETSQVIHPGDHFPAAAALRRRLAAVGDLPAGHAHAADTTAYDEALAAAVKHFQERHGLAADGVIGPGTLAAINVPLARRARQIELALERVRWLPEIQTGPFVLVNVPSFQLYGFDTLGTKGVPSLIMNVVVGKDQVGRQTPLFERDMRYIILRPFWVITRSILKNEILPAVRKNSGYLARNNMEIYRGSGDTGPAVPTTSANLAAVSRGELGIRQRPGPKNSLGLAKFIFPNDHNVYMHGTPATELFSRTRRDFSHGCIRLEDPARFAVWVLDDPKKWPLEEVRRTMDGDKSQRVNLARPLPVFIYYSTAVVRKDGSVAFFDDIYRHDAKLEALLAKGYPYEP